MNQQSRWQSFRYDIGPYLNVGSSVRHAILEFVHQVLKPLEGKQTVCFMFKIQTDQGFRSITHLQKFNIIRTPKDIVNYDEQILIDQEQNLETLNSLLSLCSESWEMVSDRYQSFYISYIVFAYKIISSEEVKQITKKPVIENKFIRHTEALIVKPEPQIYSGHHLPATMDFTQWGEFEISPDFSSAIVKKTKGNKDKETKIEYHIKIDDYNLLVDLKIGSLTAFSWIDTLDLSNNKEIKNISSNLGSFKRIIKKKIFIILKMANYNYIQ